jgi:hypothetical protein
MPAFDEPARPSLTTLPDFDAVEEVGILGEPVAAG